MLYIDRAFVTETDLLVVDSEVSAVAEAQAITVVNTIAEAISEFGSWVRGRLQRFHGRQFLGLTEADRVFQWHQESVQRPRVGVAQIVVHHPESEEWSDVKRLVVHWALWLFYRNASRRADVDRYQEKRDDYRADVLQRYQHRLVRNGLPVVTVPLPAPGATLLRGAGTFSAANSLSLVDGENAAEDLIDVAITWENADASPTVESGPSATAQKTVTTGKLCRVSTTGLTAPAGGVMSGSEQLGYVLQGTATGWHVYAGARGGTLYRQNTEVIPLATTTYDLPAVLTTTGARLGNGQDPDRYLTMVSTFDRA